MNAYQLVGSLSTFFDRMMTNADLLARLALKIFWGLDSDAYQKFLSQAFAGIPKGFSGRLLEVPVGTGVLSLPVYKKLNGAQVYCLDYSAKMLDAAKVRANQLELQGVKFIQGDVAKLPFEDSFFDLVLTQNGVHVFPDKYKASDEVNRVLRPGGTLCGCCYVSGENRRTDFFVKHFCDRFGFFTPPHVTLAELTKLLNDHYSRAQVTHVESFAGFVCIK